MLWYFFDYSVMKVLMIDDNELDLLISKKLISKQDKSLEFTEFSNATEAINFLKGQEKMDFDIVLLDLNMPEMNGWEFLDEYKELQFPKANVYILTSSLDTRDKLKSKDYEVVKGYFDKPLKHHYIAEIIKQYLN